jgi:hypothetical protein
MLRAFSVPNWMRRDISLISLLSKDDLPHDPSPSLDPFWIIAGAAADGYEK